MLALFRIAWRSIWRNKRRTAISVSAIGFSLALAIFMISLADGVYAQMIRDAVRMQGGHFTLEHPDYREAPAIDLFIDDIAFLRSKIETLEGVEFTKALTLGQGVLKSSWGSAGIAVMGVEPSVEASTSPLARNIVRGKYLEDGDQRKVVLGSKLAELLKIDVGKKVVVTSNNTAGELVEELVRVKGIFSLGVAETDAYLAQIPLSFARQLHDLSATGATQLGVVLTDPDDRPATMQQIAGLLDDADVAAYPWEEVLPELAAYVRVDRNSNLILQGIIIFLSLFTIFNTVLMSILERTREFAIQLALGTPSGFLRLQVLAESTMLALLGCVGGVTVGGAFAIWLQERGWDLRDVYGDLDVSGFAVDPVIHAQVTPGLIVGLACIVLGATLLICLLSMRHISRISVADVLR